MLPPEDRPVVGVASDILNILIIFRTLIFVLGDIGAVHRHAEPAVRRWRKPQLQIEVNAVGVQISQILGSAGR